MQTIVFLVYWLKQKFVDCRSGNLNMWNWSIQLNFFTWILSLSLHPPPFFLVADRYTSSSINGFSVLFSWKNTEHTVYIFFFINIAQKVVIVGFLTIFFPCRMLKEDCWLLLSRYFWNARRNKEVEKFLEWAWAKMNIKYLLSSTHIEKNVSL